LRKFRRYVRSFVVHFASPRIASHRHAGKEKACIRRSSNSRPAFRAACILRLVPALKFHPCSVGPPLPRRSATTASPLPTATSTSTSSSSSSSISCTATLPPSHLLFYRYSSTTQLATLRRAKLPYRRRPFYSPLALDSPNCNPSPWNSGQSSRGPASKEASFALSTYPRIMINGVLLFLALATPFHTSQNKQRRSRVAK
ncbi:hypothetical protein ALC62_04709, partial [Cyphomyrmex costatus]